MPILLDSLRLTTADGIATVSLAFPGTPVNGLSVSRLVELDRVLSPLLQSPHLDAIVLRSDLPGGFCGGWFADPRHTFATEDDATEFATTGQRIVNRLAAAVPATVALLEGPCRGPGLELALACDYRIAIAEADSAIGFCEDVADFPPCWGGFTRMSRIIGARKARPFLAGKVVNAREAVRLGLVDQACCRRRAKIELRTRLDRIQQRFRKSGRTEADAEGLALERIAVRRAVRDRLHLLRSPEAETPLNAEGFTPLAPDVVGLVGTCDAASSLAVEAALRGRQIVAVGLSDTALSRTLNGAVQEGRATPLEAEQARRRVTHSQDPHTLISAKFVIVTEDAEHRLSAWEPHMLPGTVIGVPSQELDSASARAKRPGRVVGVDLHSQRCVVKLGANTRKDVAASAIHWLNGLGVRATVRRASAPVVLRKVA